VRLVFIKQVLFVALFEHNHFLLPRAMAKFYSNASNASGASVLKDNSLGILFGLR
jgi:hypothetical protein